MTDNRLSEHIDNSRLGAAALPDAPPALRRHISERLIKPGEVPLKDVVFLNAVIDLITTILRPKLLFLGVLTNEGRTVSTFMTIQDGKRVKNFTYSLENSPCATVLGPQSMCIYPEDVATLFPLDHGLRRMGAVGYVGMPLLARDGRQIGIIASVTTHPIRDLDEVRSSLRVFGKRLALELERAVTGDDAGSDDELGEAVLIEEHRLLLAVKQAS